MVWTKLLEYWLAFQRLGCVQKLRIQKYKFVLDSCSCLRSSLVTGIQGKTFASDSWLSTVRQTYYRKDCPHCTRSCGAAYSDCSPKLILTLTLSTLGKSFSRRHIFSRRRYVFLLSEKTDFDISCKSSPSDQILFLEKTGKISWICHLLKTPGEW